MKDAVIGKTVLITGASSGIGASFARFLAGRGLRVLLTARRKSNLEDLTRQIKERGGQASYFACDLSQPSTRKKLIEQITAQVRHVDILINNAGFGWYGYFYKMTWEDAARMMAVNMEAMAHLTHMLLPDMVRAGRGHVINISSIAGGLPNQGIAMYSASKAFVDAFTTSLFRELHGSGVYASAMRLGPVETEFYDQARQMENGDPVPAERFAIPVERVNAALWRLLDHPRRFVYVPGWLRVSRWLEPLFGGLIDQLGPLLLRRTDPPKNE
jgi:hypothetical protein